MVWPVTYFQIISERGDLGGRDSQGLSIRNGHLVDEAVPGCWDGFDIPQILAVVVQRLVQQPDARYQLHLPRPGPAIPPFRTNRLRDSTGYSSVGSAFGSSSTSVFSAKRRKSGTGRIGRSPPFLLFVFDSKLRLPSGRQETLFGMVAVLTI
jgi:hypothetical protein